MNLESVFAAVGGWLILGEILSSRSLLGGALMFIGVFLARLKP
jgi:drug/metabolite transporter (DMT)-like permease